MSPYELNRQVAAATGESVAEIRARGFSVYHPDILPGEPANSRPRRRRRKRRSPQRQEITS